MPLKRQVSRLGGAEGARERQEDEGIFEPLRFVDGDHLYKFGIAFKPDLVRVGGTVVLVALLDKVTDQCVFPIEQRACLLQQFGKVQHVGQAALTRASLREQASRHTEVVEQAPQHRQHTLLAPAVAVAAKLQDRIVPGVLVVVEAVERGPVEAERARR